LIRGIPSQPEGALVSGIQGLLICGKVFDPAWPENTGRNPFTGSIVRSSPVTTAATLKQAVVLMIEANRSILISSIPESYPSLGIYL
jgi:hypothetical protein